MTTMLPVSRRGYQGVEYLRTGRLTLPITTGREHCSTSAPAASARLQSPPASVVATCRAPYAAA